MADSSPVLRDDVEPPISSINTGSWPSSLSLMSYIEPLDPQTAENTSGSGRSIRQLRRHRPFFRRRFSRHYPASTVASYEQILATGTPASASSSATSIIHGIPHFSTNGSIPSLELVSTGAFIFSSPGFAPDSAPSSRTWSEISINTGNPSTDRLQEPSALPGRTTPSSPAAIGTVELEIPQQQIPSHSTHKGKGLSVSFADNMYSNHDMDFDLPLYSLVSSLLKYVDHNTYKSLRLCSRAWERNVSAIKPPRFPAVYNLPQEVIQHIFLYLSPSDVDAAIHTCHAWYLAGFDRPLLHTMFERGGWLSGAVAEAASADIADDTSRLLLRQPGFLASRFSRECALSPTWRGMGLENSPHIDYTSDSSSPTTHSTIMALTTYTDMTELASGDPTPGSKNGCGLGFTVSVCGRFLLAAEGCVIYVYELDGSGIRLITVVICPRRVLATSMDTSAKRYSLAALLDSRMGLVCDLDAEVLQNEIPSPPIYGDNSLDASRTHQRESSVASHDVNGDTPEVATHDNDGQTAGGSQNYFMGSERISSIHVRSPHQSVSLFNACQESERRAVNRTWRRSFSPLSQGKSTFGQNLSNALPLTPGPLSIYHSLCSPDDPPRSVAICPSRRCLAFGCAAGIELHWIDAMSGRNLMKWFPLTATSDFLYFLPTRKGVDNPNKLRLISSKAGPGQRGGVDRYARKAGGRRYGLSWSSLRFSNGSRENDYDHFAAVPISDGAHILFTDPSNGRLYLGSDAPLGGPTKLSRKVVFVPPAGVTNSKEEPPSLYTTGSDLTWGVRVVAAYGDCVVLYCLPPDVFADVKKTNTTAISVARAHDEEYDFGPWKEWWDFSDVPKSSQSAFTSVNPESIGHLYTTRRIGMWPIPVHGAVIGRVRGLVDFAVQSWVDLVIWAVAADGTTRTWEIGDGLKHEAVQRLVTRDGKVVDAMDQNGDWLMRDAWTSETFQLDSQNLGSVDEDVEMVDATEEYHVKDHGSEDAGAGFDQGVFQSLPLGTRFNFDGACEFEVHDDSRTEDSLDRMEDSGAVHDTLVRDCGAKLVSVASFQSTLEGKRLRRMNSLSSQDSGYCSGAESSVHHTDVISTMEDNRTSMDGVYEFVIDEHSGVTGMPMHVDAAVNQDIVNIEMVNIETELVHQPDVHVLGSAAPAGVREREERTTMLETSWARATCLVERPRMVQRVSRHTTNWKVVSVSVSGSGKTKEYEETRGVENQGAKLGGAVMRWTESVVEEVVGVEVEVI